MVPILSKNQIKFIRGLKQKKLRYKFRKYIIEGPKSILDMVEADPQSVDFIVRSEQAAVIQNVLSHPVYQVSEEDFSGLTDLQTAQGWIAIGHIPESFFLPAEEIPSFIVYADRVQDPGNLGTIIRSASFLGISDVWIAPGTVDPFNSKVVQASMGSLATARIRQVNYSKLGQLNIPLIAADMTGENAFEFIWPEDASVLILGNEGSGPSPELLPMATHRITIPGAGNSGAESLNVSMACMALLVLRAAGLKHFQ